MDLPPITQKLLEELGFDKFTDKDKAEVLARVQEMVDREILYMLVSGLSPEKMRSIDAELNQITDEDERATKLMQALQQETPDYEEVVTRTVHDVFDRIKTDMLAVDGYLKAIHYQPPTSAQPNDQPDIN